jgi:hypothetical protein
LAAVFRRGSVFHLGFACSGHGNEAEPPGAADVEDRLYDLEEAQREEETG